MDTTLQSRRYLRIALQIGVVLACLAGIWNSLKLMRVDALARQDTVDSLQAALRLAPDDSAVCMRLAQLDDSNAIPLLQRALRANAYNAQANVELGLRYEAAGEAEQAEQALLRAYSVDHTYMTRWSLANFYLRQGNIPAFWTWAHKAAEMPSDDIRGLFQIAWNVDPDPSRIAAELVNDNPMVVRQYLAFLLEKNQNQAAIPIALRLIRVSSPSADRKLLLWTVDELVSADEVDGSSAIWNAMIQRKWVTADSTLPNNGAFARDPLPVSFDWKLSSFTGVHSWPGSRGLETEFSGDEPENCPIAEQTLVLKPGDYALNYSYQTTDIAPETGITWQLLDVKTGAVIAQSDSLSSNAMRQASLPFTIGSGTQLVKLHLNYKRALGTTRIAGKLRITSTHLEAHS
ncbi:MAG TPA: hypothetical protein VG844_18955 [Terracidiphilus sp.]|nr:hypothetical protein [Terracidiphilus sp.]